MTEFALGAILAMGTVMVALAAIVGWRSARQADADFAQRLLALREEHGRGRISDQAFIDQQILLHRQLWAARSLSPKVQRGLVTGLLLTLVGSAAFVYLKFGRSARVDSSLRLNLPLALAGLRGCQTAIGSGGTGGAKPKASLPMAGRPAGSPAERA